MSNFTNLLITAITIALLAYLFVKIFPTDKNNEDSFDLESDEEVNQEKHPYKSAVRKIFDIQTRKDGTVLVTSAASGAIRNAGVELAKHGPCFIWISVSRSTKSPRCLYRTKRN